MFHNHKTKINLARVDRAATMTVVERKQRSFCHEMAENHRVRATLLESGKSTEPVKYAI